MRNTSADGRSNRSASLANLPAEKLFWWKCDRTPSERWRARAALACVFSLASRAARAPNFGPHTETEPAAQRQRGGGSVLLSRRGDSVFTLIAGHSLHFSWHTRSAVIVDMCEAGGALNPATHTRRLKGGFFFLRSPWSVFIVILCFYAVVLFGCLACLLPELLPQTSSEAKLLRFGLRSVRETLFQ